MSQTVAEVVVETLQAAGVKHCWGVPGDTLNYVTDAIRRSGITGSMCATRKSAASRPARRRC